MALSKGAALKSRLPPMIRAGGRDFFCARCVADSNPVAVSFSYSVDGVKRVITGSITGETLQVIIDCTDVRPGKYSSVWRVTYADDTIYEYATQLYVCLYVPACPIDTSDLTELDTVLRRFKPADSIQTHLERAWESVVIQTLRHSSRITAIIEPYMLTEWVTAECLYLVLTDCGVSVDDRNTLGDRLRSAIATRNEYRKRGTQFDVAETDGSTDTDGPLCITYG